MSKLTLDLSDFKSSGVYTVEVDNSITDVVETDSLRMAVGFTNHPPFNRPVLLGTPEDRRKVFGNDINTKLERHGSFFERSLDILLDDAPVIALNLLSTDSSADVVGFTAIPLADPDSSADFSNVYDASNMWTKGNTHKYEDFFDRSRFWIPSAANLNDVVTYKTCNSLAQVKQDAAKSPLFSIVNTGTSDVTIFVIKDDDVTGYNTTVRNWYGSDNIPYSWMKPEDYISEYFVKLVVLKGNWTDFAMLSTDITWSKYFDVNGLKASEYKKFLGAEGVTTVASWSGCILPNFYNKAGNLVSLVDIVNSYTVQTGIMVSINEAALENDDAPYKIDMVGHKNAANASVKFMSYASRKFDTSVLISYPATVDASCLSQFTVKVDASNIITGTGDTKTTSGTMSLKVGDMIEGVDGLVKIIKKSYQPNGSTGGTYTFTCNGNVKNVSATEGSSEVRKYPSLANAFTHIQPTLLTGLKLSNRHYPGYSSDGSHNIEAGVEKIYGMLNDEGIKRGLADKEMISFRYIIDTLSGGINPGLGGKKYLAETAKNVGKCTAIINFPSVSQMTMSVDPLFCDASLSGSISKKFDTKYIPDGGNQDAICSNPLTLPTLDEGSSYCGIFSPYLKYRSNGRTILIPPAAHVANAFNMKYKGGNPYATIANMNGIFNDSNIVGLEYLYDAIDRDNLEPFGVNPIIKQNGRIMIYGDRTAYQDVISDLNYLHVREVLNTIELECQAVLKNYVFRTNDSVTRAEIVRKLIPIMEEKVISGAIYKYDIVMDESNNTADIINRSFGVVDLGVWCTKNMEKIVQRITIEKLSE